MVALLIGGGVVLGVIILTAGLMTALRDGQSGADRERMFAVGDCVVWNAAGTVVDRVSCSSPRAVNRVYEVVELTELARCVEVDGVERTVTLTSPQRAALCVGPKDLDPTTSINNVQRGECISSEMPPQRPHRVACTEQGARKVDARVDDPLPQNHPDAKQDCINAGAADSTLMLYYGAEGVVDGKREAHYRLLCLSDARG
ncbi:hypothetical protein [Gordonia terrae]|uniref:hypothetical protein n=1 Tax=Gordonia terrae TaxID=2055 RepID=UPI003F6D69F8